MGDLASLVGTGLEMHGAGGAGSLFGFPGLADALEPHPARLDSTPDPKALLGRARIRVSPLATGPAPWVVAQANVNLNGRPLRVQTVAESPEQAGEALCRRLRENLARLESPGAGQWTRPRDFSGFAEQTWWNAYRPQIRRRKAVVLRRQTADEAAAHMDTMDYDCHLFADADTGQDSMVHRCGPTGYRVVQLSTRSGPARRRSPLTTYSGRPVPTLTPPEAVARLRGTGLPFVFFCDAWAERPSGAVLYQRYDGNYGFLFSYAEPTAQPIA
jgi:hypothetical protein